MLLESHRTSCSSIWLLSTQRLRFANYLVFINNDCPELVLQTFTTAAYHLAAYPEYIEPLREEIADAVRTEGWTKASIDKMHKLDSFIKESLRVQGPGLSQFDCIMFVYLLELSNLTSDS